MGAFGQATRPTRSCLAKKKNTKDLDEQSPASFMPYPQLDFLGSGTVSHLSGPQRVNGIARWGLDGSHESRIDRPILRPTARNVWRFATTQHRVHPQGLTSMEITRALGNELRVHLSQESNTASGRCRVTVAWESVVVSSSTISAVSIA